MLSCVWFFATPWTAAPQVLLSMGFPRQEYWSGLPFPSPGDFPNAGIEPTSPALAGGFFTTELPGKPKKKYSLRGVTQHTFIPGMWYSKQDSASAGTRMNLAPVQSPSRLCVQPSWGVGGTAERRRGWCEDTGWAWPLPHTLPHAGPAEGGRDWGRNRSHVGRLI